MCLHHYSLDASQKSQSGIASTVHFKYHVEVCVYVTQVPNIKTQLIAWHAFTI